MIGALLWTIWWSMRQSKKQSDHESKMMEMQETHHQARADAERDLLKEQMIERKRDRIISGYAQWASGAVAFCNARARGNSEFAIESYAKMQEAQLVVRLLDKDEFGATVMTVSQRVTALPANERGTASEAIAQVRETVESRLEAWRAKRT